jgi:transposase
MSATATQRTHITPPEIARRLGVGVEKVHSWIRRGELKAFNAASNANGKPRWLVSLVDLETFQVARGVKNG